MTLKSRNERAGALEGRRRERGGREGRRRERGEGGAARIYVRLLKAGEGARRSAIMKALCLFAVVTL